MEFADLERAVSTTQAVMARVGPDQLDAPTPCASWKVRDVINHVVGGTFFFTAIAETGAVPTGGDDLPDFASGDYNATYAAKSAEMLAAFGADGALDKSMDFGFMNVPGKVGINLVITDTFAHAWDIARALGDTGDLEPELAGKVFEHAKVAIPDAFRGEEGKAAFGPIVDVPDSAPAADQLAGFLGRQV